MACCPHGVYVPLVRDCAGNIISLPWGSSLRSTLVITTTVNLAPVNNSIILVDATSNSVTITLPPVSPNLEFVIKRIDSSINIVTVDGFGSETIDELTNRTLTQYESIRVVSDGTEWWII